MDKQESRMFRLIGINHECRALADRLNAISGRRRRRGKRAANRS